MVEKVNEMVHYQNLTNYKDIVLLRYTNTRYGKNTTCVCRTFTTKYIGG